VAEARLTKKVTEAPRVCSDS